MLIKTYFYKDTGINKLKQMGLFNRKKKKKENSNQNTQPQQQSSEQDEFTASLCQAAEQCIQNMEPRLNGKLDYSVSSLELLDQGLDEASDFFEDMPEGQQEGLVQAAGAYVFEVARRNYGGKYFWYDKRNQPILVTGMPEFEISLLAMDKVRGRLVNGMEDNIPFFFEGYKERVEKAQPGDKAMVV